MIFKRISFVFEKNIPIGFRCDICGRELVLTDSYDLKYESDVSKHLAVLKYSTPSGGFSSDNVRYELHSCSHECTCKALSLVPFDCVLTLPINRKFYDKERGTNNDSY